MEECLRIIKGRVSALLEVRQDNSSINVVIESYFYHELNDRTICKIIDATLKEYGIKFNAMKRYWIDS